MKKLLSYLLLVVMVFSLSACGSKGEKADNKSGKKADVDVMEFLEEVNLSKVNAAEGELKIAAKGKADGQNVKLDASIDFQANNLGKDDMTIKIPMTINVDGEKVEAAVYYVDGVFYAETEEFLGQNLKLEYDFSELLSEMDVELEEDDEELATDVDKEKIKEMANPQIKEKGGKYVITFDFDWDKVLEIAEEEAADNMEELQNMECDTFELSLTCKKDGSIEEIAFDVAMSMEVDGTTVDMSMEGNVEFTTGDIKISLPNFKDYVDASMMLQQLM